MAIDTNFSGGAKLEAKLREIAEKAGRGGVLKVGFLAGATYPKGTPVATVAAWMEYGTVGKDGKSHIPPRPFFRTMIAEKSDKWGDSLARIMEGNGYDVRVSLSLMGEGISGQLKESILNRRYAPLSKETIKRKGNDQTLVETSNMINSVSYQVTLK